MSETERQVKVLQSEEARSNQTQNKDASDDNEKHSKQMRNLDDLQRELVHMKTKLNDATIRAQKLNIDAAIMFNPNTLANLEAYKEQCDICLARMWQILNEPLDVVNKEGGKQPTI